MDVLFYLLIAFAGFVVFIQVLTRVQALLKKGKDAPNVGGHVGKMIARHPRVLLYFYTPTCSACKVMTPIIDRLRKEYGNIVKVDLTRDMKIGKAFGVMGTPSLVVVENNKIRSFIVGARNENSIRRLLET